MSFDEDDSSESYDDHDLLFGDHDDHDDGDHPYGGHSVAVVTGTRRASRRDSARRRRLRRRRAIFTVLALLIAVAVAVTAAVTLHTSSASTQDYTGTGTGVVVIQVQPGDGVDAIASTLLGKGVIGSTGAFATAAAGNAKSSQIQPGYYRLRSHMSALSALNLLLDPSSSISEKLVIPEGLIENDVVTRLVTALGVSKAEVQKAVSDVADLVPGGYTAAKGNVTSLEGFLYPLTYNFDPGTSAQEAVQQLVSSFISEDRSIGFASGAAKIGITPYEALIIASIAQAEVKFPEDAPKVARVIMNRLAADQPLQVDATSAYAAKEQGLDVANVTYSTLDTPYNTYTHAGLPPTPIGNPGETSLQAAINPTPGDWLFYVNIDAQGHLGFFPDEASFTAAQQTCHDNGWGCAAP